MSDREDAPIPATASSPAATSLTPSFKLSSMASKVGRSRVAIFGAEAADAAAAATDTTPAAPPDAADTPLTPVAPRMLTNVLDLAESPMQTLKTTRMQRGAEGDPLLPLSPTRKQARLAQGTPSSAVISRNSSSSDASFWLRGIAEPPPLPKAVTAAMHQHLQHSPDPAAAATASIPGPRPAEPFKVPRVPPPSSAPLASPPSMAASPPASLLSAGMATPGLDASMHSEHAMGGAFPLASGELRHALEEPEVFQVSQIDEEAFINLQSANQQLVDALETLGGVRDELNSMIIDASCTHMEVMMLRDPALHSRIEEAISLFRPRPGHVTSTCE